MAKKRKRKKRKTTDLLKIVDDRFYKTPRARARLAEAEATAEVARQIYTLRKEAGLTQRQLAELVGTQHTVISRLEDDDYQGHSLSMLRRIAAALGKRVEIRFRPARDAKTA